MSGSIFISYRREDTQHAAARLSDRLEQEFSREHVFFDVETLPAGVDFAEEVARRIDACDAFVVMIGKSWLDIRDSEGRRRLDNPDDHVRMEIARALKAKKRMLPVLVDNASMPLRKDLPDALKPMTDRNAAKLAHESFRTDCDRLVASLKVAMGDVERNRQVAEESITAKLRSVRPYEPRIFLAYSRADFLAADAMFDTLVRNGFAVSMDRHDLPYGEDWRTGLSNLIAASDTVAWLVSPDSVASPWCNWELDEIGRLAKRLVPIMIREVSLAKLPSAVHSLHLSSWVPLQGVYNPVWDEAQLVEMLMPNRLS